jgi:hypothetical protein
MDPNIEKIIELEKQKAALEAEVIYQHQALCNIRSVCSINGQSFYIANAAILAYVQRRK